MQASAATTSLRVIVAEDDNVVRDSLANTLEVVHGHTVVGQAANGLELVEVALRAEVQLILFDVHLPQLNGLDALRRIAEQKPVASVAVTGDQDPALVRRCCQERVHGFLLKPIQASQLGPVIEIAHARFLDIQRLLEENERLERSLESRKIVERAKGVLMRRFRWTEADAFRRLQRAAMNRRTSMAELAKQILDGKDIDL